MVFVIASVRLYDMDDERQNIFIKRKSQIDIQEDTPNSKNQRKCVGSVYHPPLNLRPNIPVTNCPMQSTIVSVKEHGILESPSFLNTADPRVEQNCPHGKPVSDNSISSTAVISSTCTDVSDSLDKENSRNAGVPRKRVHIPPDKLTKKRTLNPSKWKASAAKTALNHGLEHLSVDGKRCIPARKLGESCGPGCRFKCSSKLTEEDRENILSQFWAIGDHARQWDFITRHVNVCAKLSNIENDTRRKESRTYFFKINGAEVLQNYVP